MGTLNDTAKIIAAMRAWPTPSSAATNEIPL
jgi:hypothetical protein